MNVVFIGGCPRSGTTLLGDLLGVSREAVVTPESQFKTSLIRRHGQEAPHKALDRVLGSFRFSLWGIHPDRQTCLDALNQGPGALMRLLVRQYSNAIGRSATPGAWIDHTPVNLQHSVSLLSAFPDAKFVHVVRDARAVAASVLRLTWGPNSIAHAGLFWTSSMAFGLGAELTLGGERIMRVRFESLVTAPEPTLREICAFLDIGYDPGMLRGGGFRVPAYTSCQHSRVGHGIDAQTAQNWRKVLSRRQVERLEETCGGLLETLGYSLESPPDTSPSNAWERLRDEVAEQAGRLRNRIVTAARQHAGKGQPFPVGPRGGK